jgi:cobalt-precorrin 5A hydrolase
VAAGDARHPLAGGEAMMVAGIGCRRGATADAVVAAFDLALEHCNIERPQIAALATAADKSGEAGIADAARSLGLRLVFLTPPRLQLASAGALTVSQRVLSLKGIPSVAETAALAAAGSGARLLGPRVATPTVTCAIAVGETP